MLYNSKQLNFYNIIVNNVTICIYRKTTINVDVQAKCFSNVFKIAKENYILSKIKIQNDFFGDVRSIRKKTDDV